MRLSKRSQAGKWVFILFYIFFLSVTLYILSISPFPNVVYAQANLTVTPPTCNIGGWTAILDALLCAVNYVAFFFQFMTISVAEGYAWLWTVLFAPFVITMAWVVAEFIRGTD